MHVFSVQLPSVLYCQFEGMCLSLSGFRGGQMVEVQYVDFGNIKTLSVNDIRQIKDEFFALPAMVRVLQISL